MTKRKIPKIISDVGFDFHWSEEKVWKLNVPVKEILLKELEWHFDIHFWSKKGGYYDIKPKDVIDKKDIYKDEFNRTMQSNLEYPLDIMFWKERWLLLDGLHRLLKAKILGLEKVKVRKIPKKSIPLISK